jgi:hypothetical protein
MESSDYKDHEHRSITGEIMSTYLSTRRHHIVILEKLFLVHVIRPK